MCEGSYHQIEVLKSQVDMRGMGRWRHPDPRSIGEIEVTRPDLQLRGIWKKVDVAAGPRPGPRLGFSSWVWNGAFYVTGGQLQSEAYHYDLW